MVNVGEYYQHHDGNVYKVIAIALHHDSLNEFVVFKALVAMPPYTKDAVWIRPVRVFDAFFVKNGILTKRYTRLSWKSLLLWRIRRIFGRKNSC